MEEAWRDVETRYTARGVDVAALDDDRRAALSARMILGDPDTVHPHPEGFA